MCLNKVGLGGVLSKRPWIQDPRCSEKFPEHLGSWIQARFQSALKAHHPDRNCTQNPMYLNKFGLGGVLSKRFESAPGSKIQDAQKKFPEHLGSWIQGRFQSALKAHPPNRIGTNTRDPGQGSCCSLLSQIPSTHTHNKQEQGATTNEKTGEHTHTHKHTAA